jgi:hypothetical protein
MVVTKALFVSILAQYSDCWPLMEVYSKTCRVYSNPIRVVSLVSFKDKSMPYNAGFAQGYLGLALEGSHTQQFLSGYKNGTNERVFNHGEVQGYYAIQPTSNNPDYLQGWQQGNGTRHNFGFDKNFISLSQATEDNYLHFFIGYQDGKTSVDNAPDNQLTAKCPIGSEREYCAGYIGGVNEESHVFHDA